MPVHERRAPPHRVRPAEIRRRGFDWPPAGVAASAYPEDARGRVDLEEVLADLRRSHARWRGELGAARDMAARAARDAYGAVSDLAEGRAKLGARIGAIENAIGEVERIVTELDRTAARAARWRWLLCGTYLLAAVVGGVVHAQALLQVPLELPRLAWSSSSTETDVSSRMAETREKLGAALPGSARWLAPSALFWIDDRADPLTSPTRWAYENKTIRERVGDVNQSIEAVEGEYERAAVLMLSIFGVGLLLGLLGLARPGLLAAIAMCLPPLFATPVATEPLIGVDNPHLLYWVAPLLVSGAGFLLMQTFRAR